MRLLPLLWCLPLLVACAPNWQGVRTDVNGIPYLQCGEQLQKPDQLGLGAIQQRISDGNLYAALAQIQTLPATVPEVAIKRADVLRQLKSAEAASWYQRLITDCDLAEGYHGLGLWVADQQDWSRALTLLKQAVAKKPAEPRYRNDLGFALLMNGDDSGARFEFRTASELSPKERGPLLNLLLLALVTRDQYAVQNWQSRLQPTAEEQRALLAACGKVVSERSRKSMQLPEGVARQLACPTQ